MTEKIVDLSALVIHPSVYEVEPGWVVSISMNCMLGKGEGAIASADRLSQRQWLVSRVFVPEFYRSKGVGSLLLTKLKEELAKVHQFRRVMVSPGGYGSDPERLHRFYTRNGFNKQGEENIYVWGYRAIARTRTDIATGDGAQSGPREVEGAIGTRRVDV